jgi:predicted O-methyltransferase YrrM
MDKLKEIEVTAPTDICPHPEWWNSEDVWGTEVENSILIAALVTATQPEFVVEIGSYTGQTTELIGNAVIENGHGEFVSLEIDHVKYNIATTRCMKLLSNDNIHIFNMDSRTFVPPKPIGLLYVDGGPDRQIDVRYYSPYMAPHSMIIVHDMAHQDYIEKIPEMLESCGSSEYIRIDSPRGLVIIKLP